MLTVQQPALLPWFWHEKETIVPLPRRFYTRHLSTVFLDMRSNSMGDVTQILKAIDSGDNSAADDLLPLIYGELRRLAAVKLAGEKPGQTLQATGLVHEAYIRLVDSKTPQTWNSRGHFFIAAAEAMRRILVEAARRKRGLKHGGHLERIELVEHDLADSRPSDDVLALSGAIEELEAIDAVAAKVVKLRYFAGLTMVETASAIGVSRATAYRHWFYARAWLHNALFGSDARQENS